MGYKYFRGEKCNPDWESLESPEAKSARGHGWLWFRRIVIAEHQMQCDSCKVTLHELWLVGRTLDVHHKIKMSAARHLRFEKSNCMVLCQPCHSKAEKGLSLQKENLKCT